MIKVVGIDPGLADTGIGIVTGWALDVSGYAYGSIQTDKTLSLAARLECIFSQLSTLLRAQQPDLMVVEDVFSLARYPKSAIILGKVCGVILLAGQHLKLPIVEIPVREAKQTLTGSGNAAKAQLEIAVRHRLRAACAIRPDHASDALGLALIGLARYEVLCRRLPSVTTPVSSPQTS